MPADPLPRYGLRGRVVTMNAARDVIADGIVWVADGTITDVTPAGQTPPAHAGSPVIASTGTIYPGMIELHNHLAYNAIPLFRIPRLYTKREEWQGTKGYRRYVSGPAGVIASLPDLIRATIRYVECKSLVSGTTTSQGLTLRAAPIKHLYKGIVRNAEQPDAAGLDPARPKIGDVTPDGRESFRKSLTGKGARIVHLAEGLPTSKAHDHFLDLRFSNGTWAIGPKFVGIHSTALRPEDLGVMHQNGGSIVWSPFSNLILYGGTTDVQTAVQLGVNVALGSDWAPTASKNLLNELKVARILSDDQQLGLSDLQLVEMVTVNPARMLGWQGSLGSIEPNRLADFAVVAGKTGDPYRHLIDATETDIRLVDHRRRRPLRDAGAAGQAQPGRRGVRGRRQHARLPSRHARSRPGARPDGPRRRRDRPRRRARAHARARRGHRLGLRLDGARHRGRPKRRRRRRGCALVPRSRPAADRRPRPDHLPGHGPGAPRRRDRSRELRLHRGPVDPRSAGDRRRRHLLRHAGEPREPARGHPDQAARPLRRDSRTPRRSASVRPTTTTRSHRCRWPTC